MDRYEMGGGEDVMGSGKASLVDQTTPLPSAGCITSSAGEGSGLVHETMVKLDEMVCGGDH